MKELLQEMLFLDERTGKFSTSKFMTLVTFYFILFINVKALYQDKEVKNAGALQELFLINSGLYLGRRMSLKTKNMEFNNDQSNP